MLVTNSSNNIFFAYLSNSIIGIVTSRPWHLKKKQTNLIKEGRYFNYKKKGHTAYNQL